MLRLYDTAKRAKVDFVPSVEGRVSMYVCGATPYDLPHLGHGRKEVVFDTIRRYLVWRGYAVKYVSNVTDIEDKIIARAHEEGTTEPELVARFEVTFRSAFDRLNILRPDDEPRATEWIEEMTRLIAQLVANGHAYVVEGQGVYFQVDTLPSYGSLSHRTLDELLESAGARVDVDERKRKRYLALMQEQAKSMQRLVDDLLTLSSLESDQNALAEGEFAIVPLLLELSADAKALSGGHVPVGAVLTHKWVFDKVFNSMVRAVVHGSTFSKNDLAMAAGLATLQVIESEKLIERSAQRGERLLRFRFDQAGRLGLPLRHG